MCKQCSAPAGCLPVEVAVAAPLSSTLTYAVPPGMAADLVPGMRLLVPLGPRLVTGYCLAFLPEAPAGGKLKMIAEVLDRTPLFPAELIPFYRWIAAYYRHPLGEVIRTALPGGLSPRSGRRIVLTPEGKAGILSRPAEAPWLEKLLSQGELPPAAVRSLWQRPTCRQQLERLAGEGLVRIEEAMGRDGVKPKTEFFLSCLPGKEPPAKLKPSEQKTLALMARLAGEKGHEWIPRQELVRAYAGARKAVPALLASGLLAGEERPVYRDPFGELPPFFPKPAQLTGDQAAALGEIEPAVQGGSFQVFLLHGVTGSGKTEVYLRAAETALAGSRSVLVLVPEIALATQLEAHFLSRFGPRVALLHSGLSPGERYDQWQRLASGRAQVVIGARSAIFAPVRDPGLIIVDEEHDGAYKQEDGLHYQARDLAVLRARFQQATVILGSATPAVTSFQHARNGKFRLLSLPARIENQPLPRVQVIDLRQVKTVSGRAPLFSPPLLAALREELAAGNQSLLFLNRRGFAGLLLCRQCGQTIRCRHCEVSLTLHKRRNELVCHYCGFTLRGASLCANCQTADFLELGSGTEKVETELAALFPRARITRLDRDAAAGRRQYLEILRAVRQREIDILVGTQMITKGHHFPHVTLVGVIWADAGLGLPDLKAGERTFQLLSQVAGRTGRGDKPGRVIIQTFQPDHYSVVTASRHDYLTFFEREISLRQQLGFPPFSRLINLRLEGEDEHQVQAAISQLAAQAKALAGRKGPEVLGPAPAPLSRLRGRYRWQLLLRGPSAAKLQRLCARLLETLPAAVRSRPLKLSVDVDPDSML